MSWKPRNGTIPKPEISKLFKSIGTRLNKILRVNLLSPFWIKSVCLKNKWRTLWLIPSKISLLKELAGENRQGLNQPDPTHMGYLSLVLIGSVWKQLFRKVPKRFSNASVYSKQICHSAGNMSQYSEKSLAVMIDTPDTTAWCL